MDDLRALPSHARRWFAHLLSAAYCFIGPLWLTSVLAQAPRVPVVSGDVIVKFRDATDPGAQLAAVLDGQRGVASLVPLAQRLSAELGVPLLLPQVTSGREALLALDRGEIARTLLARAINDPSVKHAMLNDHRPPSGIPGAELVLHIELRSRTASSARLTLPARLAVMGMVVPRMSGFAIKDRADSIANVITLHYDLDLVTLALIERIQQRPDVEYAQANLLLRALAPPPAAASR